MEGVEKVYTDYFHKSTGRDAYGYTIYNSNSLLYPKEANKVAGFAGEYDLQKALKDKNIRDVANAYGWDENTLRKVDAWSQVGANIAAGWLGHKLAANTKPQVIPKEANANSKLPPVGETKGYANLKLGETAVINGVEHIRVGRWMSKGELSIMKNSGKIASGGGGLTFISINGINDYKGVAPKGSVYVEFNVPKNSLIQGGKSGWFKMVNDEAKSSQKFMFIK